MIRQLTCLLLLVLAVPLSAEELGRLFYTPAERRMIDMRQAPGGDKYQGVDAASSTEPEGLKLRGVVRAKNGHTTVWLNESMTIQGKQPSGAADTAPVVLPDGRSTRMRVGEEWQNGAIAPPVVKIQPSKR